MLSLSECQKGLDPDLHKNHTLFFLHFLVFCWFFPKSTFSKNSFMNTIRVSNRWIQIRTYILSVPIWVQFVWKGYPQTTQDDASKENVKIKKFFHEHYQSVKQFGSRSGLTFCGSWSGSKLFEKVIRRRQKLTLARKELKSKTREMYNIL